MKIEEVGTQTDINMAEMKRLAWMDNDEAERVREVANIKKKLERSEYLYGEFFNKVKELREENQRLEKYKIDLQGRCSQDKEVIIALTASINSLEMVNKEQAHKIKDLFRKIPCRKVDCKSQKECNMSHEFKTAMLTPNKSILCTYFLKNQCNRGDRCRWSHDLSKHPLDKVRDQVENIQSGNVRGGGEGEEAGESQNQGLIQEAMDEDNSEVIQEVELEVAVEVRPDLELEEVSQQPLPAEAEDQVGQDEPEDHDGARGVKGQGGARPKVRSRGRGTKPQRPSSAEVRRMQAGRGFGGRGFDHAKALKTQEYYVQNIKNRGRSRERGVSPSPRKGQKSRGSSRGSSGSFVSAKSSFSSRSNSNTRSGDKRPSSAPRRVAPPRPKSIERPRSVGDSSRSSRIPPRRPPSDREIGRWYRREMEEEERNNRRSNNVPARVASREDLRVMSEDGVRYVQERLINFSQSGNGNGQRFPSSSGPNNFRGNYGELRERAVDRMNTRTSDRIHSGEVYNVAAGRMRERMERNLYSRR